MTFPSSYRRKGASPLDCSLRAQALHYSVSTVSLQCLYSVSTVSLQCLYCSLRAQALHYSVSTVSLQCLYSVSTVSLQCLYCSLRAQALHYSVSTVSLQCLYSVSTVLCAPRHFIIVSLQCLYSVSTVSLLFFARPGTWFFCIQFSLNFSLCTPRHLRHLHFPCDVGGSLLFSSFFFCARPGTSVSSIDMSNNDVGQESALNLWSKQAP